jgi:hypothetical protein
MPLIWTPVQSIARWKTPPGPPRVARAAVAGIGWLVAAEVAGGWNVTFVPDANAADPPDGPAAVSFQAARVEWAPPEGAAPQPKEPAPKPKPKPRR